MLERAAVGFVAVSIAPLGVARCPSQRDTKRTDADRWIKLGKSWVRSR